MPKKPRTSISLDPETRDLIEAARDYEEEPLRKIVRRSIEFYVLSHPKNPPRAAPERPQEVPA